MEGTANAILAGIFSGAVISAVLGILFHGRNKAMEAKIKDEFLSEESNYFDRSGNGRRCQWHKLLGPVHMQIDRTGRAFDRWTSKNLYIEAKVIREGNLRIRDLLLGNGQLIPPELLDHAGKLIEHYDRWEFEKQRLAEKPDIDAPFTFVGPAGYPFPRESEKRFREAFKRYWDELYRGSSQ